jgi:hypothetical protein
LRKGFRADVDSYSAFFENDRATRTGLTGYLRERGLRRVFLAGLALDYCVRYSAEDAIKAGFAATVVAGMVAGADSIDDLDVSYARAWQSAHRLPERPRAVEMDARLHAERIALRPRRQRTWSAPVRHCPMARWSATPTRWGCCLAHGFRPLLHPAPATTAGQPRPTRVKRAAQPGQSSSSAAPQRQVTTNDRPRVTPAGRSVITALPSLRSADQKSWIAYFCGHGYRKLALTISC